MKRIIKLADGTEVSISSKDKDLVKKVEKEIREKLEKANRIEKIERPEPLDL